MATIDDVFSNEEQFMLTEALQAFRSQKTQAFASAEELAAGWETSVLTDRTGFTAADFGIPMIDALLARLVEEPEAEEEPEPFQRP